MDKIIFCVCVAMYHSVSYGKPPIFGGIFQIFGGIFQQWVEPVKEQVRIKTFKKGGISWN